MLTVLTLPASLLRRLFGASSDASTIPAPLRALDCMEYEDRTLFSATPVGGELLVNAATSGAQQVHAESQQAVAADSSGNFVVVWTSNGQDGSGNGVYAQRFDASGTAVGGEIQVNTTTANEQLHASVAVDASGDFVVAWESLLQDGAGYGIFAQRFDASGATVGGEFQVNTTTTSDQRYPSVAMDAAGNIVITWSSFGQDGDGYGVFGQLYDSGGATQGSEFQISTATTGDQVYSSVAFAGTGDFIVTWTGQDADSTGIYAQRFNSAGVAQGGEIAVNTTTTDAQTYSSVGADASGNFVITWSSNLQDGGGYGIYAQRFDATGATVGSEFRVNVTTAGDQTVPRVAMAADGSFVVTWTSNNQDASGTNGVYFRQYDATGTALTPETLANQTIAGNQQYSSLAMQSNDSFVVVWSGSGSGDASGVFAQLYEDGTNLAPVNAVPGAQSTNEDTALVFSTGNGNAISIADADAHSNRIQVTLTATNGTLTLATLTGLTFSAGDGTNDLTMTFVGTITDLNAALDGLTFTPTGNFVGAAGVAITTNDLGYSGTGGAKSDSDSVTVTVNAVNDPPVITAPDGVSTNINMPRTFSTAEDDAISISDVDAGSSPVRLTLTISNGTASLSQTTGLSFTTGDGTSDALMTFTGTIADINAALEGLTFTPTNNFSGTAGIQIDVNDQGNTGSGGAQTATYTTSVAVLSGTRVNTQTASNQHEPAIAMDALGNYVVVWTSDNQDGGGKGVYGQRFDSTGTAVGAEFRVNVTTAGDQNVPAVAMDANGNFVVVWTSNNQDGDNKGIYGRLYDAAGVAQGGEFLVNVTTSGAQDQAAVAMDASGNFVIAWKSDRGGVGTDVYVRVFDAAGTAQTGEIRANTNTADNQDQPAVAVDAAGNFVVVWRGSHQDTSGAGVFGQRFNAAGVAQGTEFQVNTTASGDQNRPFVAMAPDGRFVVTWSSGNNQDGNGRGIYLQRYDAAGVAQGTETLVNTETNKDQDWSGVAMDASGNFVVAWMSKEQDGSKNGIYAQKFAADGSTIGGEFLVNPTTLNEQKNPVIASGYYGDFAVAWEGNGVGDTQGVFTHDYPHANQSPTITVPAAQAATEDTTLVFSSGNGNLISVSDADAYTSPVQVTLTISGGTGALTLAATTGLSFSAGTGTGDATMTFTGTVADVNAALNGLQYAPASGYNGATTLSVSVNDQGNHGTGGAKTDNDGVGITVSPVNDPPTNSVPGAQSTGEDTALVFSSGNGNQISIADPDASTNPVQVTLTATNGTITLNGTTGLSFSAGDGTSDATMTFTGTITDINTALNGLSFTPTNNYSGAANLQIVTNDQGNTGSGGALSDTDNVAITVNPLNDPPVNTVPGAQSTNEDTALVFSSGNGNQISIADVDAGSSSVQVTLTATSGTVTLNGVTGLSFSAGDGTADAVMTFTGTITNINTALNGLTFTPTGNYNGAASLQIATDDQGNTGAGGALSDTDTVNITVNAVNDAPVNTVPGAQSTNEDTALVFSSGNGNQISIDDIDAGSSSVQVTLTATNGAISLNGVTGLSFSAGDGTSDAMMTFTGTIADINTALNGLAFTPTNNYSGAANLQIVTNDQGNTGSGGALSDTDNIAITVNAVNDAPVNAVPGAQSTNEDTALVFSSGNGNQISVADVDAGTNPVQVTLTATNGAITLNGTTGLSFSAGDGASDATMTFTGTIASINTALNGLSFTPTNNYSGAANLQIVTNDQGNTGSGGALSDTDNIAITVNAVNDAPTLSLPGAQSTSFNTPITFSTANGNAVVVADSDAGGAAIELSLSVANGSLTLAQTTGLTFLTGTGTNDATIVVQGTAANLNAALDGLVYSPTSTYRGADTLSVAVDDLGNTGGGGAQSTSGSVGLTIAAAAQRLTLSAPTSQAANNYAVVFSSANGNAITFSDVYAENPVLSVSLSATDGTFALGSSSGLTFTSGGPSGPGMSFTGTLSDVNAALQGSTFTASTSDSSLSIVGSDPPRDGTGSQTVSAVIAISQPTIYPAPSPAPVIEPETTETVDNDSAPEVIVSRAAPAIVPAALDKIFGGGENRSGQKQVLAAPFVDPKTESALAKDEVPTSTTEATDELELLAHRNASVTAVDKREAVVRGEVLDLEIPWTPVVFSDSEQGDQSLSHSLIVGTAGITASLSVGYALWSVRAASMLSTLLSSMPAWQTFDPLPVIEFARQAAAKDDEEEDELSNKLFDSPSETT